MTYVYLLAGENLGLAAAELSGFLESQRVDPGTDRYGRLAIAADPEEGQLRRLGLVQEVSELLERGDTGKIEPGYSPGASFAVRAVDVNDAGHDTEALEQEVGRVLEGDDNAVDLENPEEELRLYLLEDEYLLARLVEDIDRSLFKKRGNEERPFSSPVSLDPVLARVLVNLSGAPPGSRVLDPFCGTGGILIEAGLCGIGVHGLDVQQEMVEGARENLEEYGIINHDIRQGRVSDAPGIFGHGFEAVVTDLPYGTASKVEGQPVEDLLEVAPELAGGKTVFMSDQEEINGLKPDFEFYEHKSLTRYIYVMECRRK